MAERKKKIKKTGAVGTKKNSAASGRIKKSVTKENSGSKSSKAKARKRQQAADKTKGRVKKITTSKTESSPVKEKAKKVSRSKKGSTKDNGRNMTRKVSAKKKIKVAFVSPEAMPLVKVGGLADVVGSLPKALSQLGVESIVLLPAYREVYDKGYTISDTGIKISSPVGANWIEASIKRLDINGISYYLVDCPVFFDRDEVYGDYEDNLERFSFFSKIALELLKRIDFKADIIHSNDWQTGLLPVFKEAFYSEDAFFDDTKVVFSIHNLAYQGLFPVDKFYILGLDWSYFTYQGIEFYGKINCMKAGVIYSDFVLTVSPTYAKEIQMPEYGYGLDGVLRANKHKLGGILNGIDYDYWNPWRDEFIYQHYGMKGSRMHIKGKVINKLKLFEDLGIKGNNNTALIIIVSRLVEQKGIDIAVSVIDSLIKGSNVSCIVLGKGDRHYEGMVEELANRHPGLCKSILEFNESLAHRLYAAGDMILIPSRFEPCGLSQMIGMRYGTIPVARRTGGLADTIASDNGFLFDRLDYNDLLSILDTALEEFFERPRDWQKRVKSAMMSDFSWNRSAKQYLKVYKQLLKK